MTNSKIISTMEWIIATIIIINFNSVYSSMLSIRREIFYFDLIVLTLASLIILALSRKRYIRFREIFKLLVLVVYLAIYGLVQSYNRDLFLTMAYILVLFMSLNIFSGETNILKKILIKYANLMVYIAAISLFFWIFGSILKIIPSIGRTSISWGGEHDIVNYYNIYFETQTSSLGNLLKTVIIRNTAIFTEAPMAALNFSIAFFVLTFFDKNTNKNKIIVLIIAIISTLSMTGYLFILGLLIVNYIYLEQNSFSKMFKFFTLPFISIGVLFVIKIFVLSKSTTISGKLRQDDYRILVESWNIHPWFGSGIYNHEFIFNFLPFWRQNQMLTGISNSVTLLWINGGLYLCMLYIFAFLAGIYNGIKHKEYSLLLFSLALIVLFITNVFPYEYMSLLCIVLFISGLNSNKERV